MKEHFAEQIAENEKNGDATSNMPLFFFYEYVKNPKKGTIRTEIIKTFINELPGYAHLTLMRGGIIPRFKI